MGSLPWPLHVLPCGAGLFALWAQRFKPRILVIPMPSRKPTIRAYVSPGEYGRILESANRAGLSLSTFAKRVCLGQEVESKVDARAVLDLLKINADLGRLGGLLKLWLTEPDQHAPDVRQLLREIMDAKEDLVAKVKQL